jgi:ribonuclease G
LRREILIDSLPGEVRIAVLEDDLLTEVFVERGARRSVAGNVYKGRVRNILPGMQSAFVDIGLERDAFLYVEDLSGGLDRVRRLEGGEAEGEEQDSGERPRPDVAIEDLIRVGQEVIVQVAKDPIAQKGARITSHVALPGRYLVYLPGVDHVGVSRKIVEEAERDRLKRIGAALVESLALQGGLILRTAGEGGRAEQFEVDGARLAGIWDGLRRRAEACEAPALLHQEAGAVEKVLRDIFHDGVEEVVIDSPEVRDEVIRIMTGLQPELAGRVRLHDGASPLFDARGVVAQLERALRPRCWLRSGGYIVINQTEALVAIDVNTGKYVGRRRLEETILRTNLEAAREIVRQVRLRDLGGIIVIDFIDMREPASRQELIETLQSELARDRSKSRVLEISEFGIVEITRQRTKPSLERLLCRPCPVCGGSGSVKTAETLYFEIVREGRRGRWGSQGGGLVLRLHPDLLGPFAERRELLAGDLGMRNPDRLAIEAEPDLPPGQWRLAPSD